MYCTLWKLCGFGDLQAIHGALVSTGVEDDAASLAFNVAVLSCDTRTLDVNVSVPMSECGLSCVNTHTFYFSLEMTVFSSHHFKQHCTKQMCFFSIIIKAHKMPMSSCDRLLFFSSMELSVTTHSPLSSLTFFFHTLLVFLCVWRLPQTDRWEEKSNNSSLLWVRTVAPGEHGGRGWDRRI